MGLSVIVQHDEVLVQQPKLKTRRTLWQSSRLKSN